MAEDIPLDLWCVEQSRQGAGTECWREHDLPTTQLPCLAENDYRHPNCLGTDDEVRSPPELQARGGREPKHADKMLAQRLGGNEEAVLG